MPRLVLASGNAGKLAELQSLLQETAWQVSPQSEFSVAEAEETGLTFVENALIKARNACRHTDLPAIADDSGIEVDALRGQPGIYSARFSGPNASDERNNAKLLDLLQGIPDEQRTARYQCILVYLRHADDPTPVICQAAWEGRILTVPAGDGGFGYDPLFFVPSHSCTAAQLPKTEKNRISHRARAFRELAAKLGSY